MSDTDTDTIADQLLAALSPTVYECSSLKRLSGGSSAFTYRGTLKTPLAEGQNTMVTKHTEPYIARAPTWPLEVSRSEYEVVLLEFVSSVPPTIQSNIKVSAPRTLPLEPHLLNDMPRPVILEDLPSSTHLGLYLTTHGPSLPSSVVQSLGLAIGKWLINFHNIANDPEATTARELHKNLEGNKAMKELKFFINIGRYRGAIEKFGNGEIQWGDAEVYDEIEEDLRKWVWDEGDKVIHGNFWNGNIILKDTPFSTSFDDAQTDIFIIDYEFSHLGFFAQDLGQCFAEVYLTYHFDGIAAAADLIRWIAEGYLSGMLPQQPHKGPEGNADDLAFRTAICCGIHLVCWPWRVGGRPIDKKMIACVAFGNECLLRGWRRDREWFGGGLLEGLF